MSIKLQFYAPMQHSARTIKLTLRLSRFDQLMSLWPSSTDVRTAVTSGM